MARPQIFPNACIYCGKNLYLDTCAVLTRNHKPMYGKRKIKQKDGTVSIEPWRQFCSPVMQTGGSDFMSKRRSCVKLNQDFENLLKSAQNINDKSIQDLVQIMQFLMVERKPRDIMHMHLTACIKEDAMPVLANNRNFINPYLHICK